MVEHVVSSRFIRASGPDTQPVMHLSTYPFQMTLFDYVIPRHMLEAEEEEATNKQCFQ